MNNTIKISPKAVIFYFVLQFVLLVCFNIGIVYGFGLITEVRGLMMGILSGITMIWVVKNIMSSIDHFFTALVFTVLAYKQNVDVEALRREKQPLFIQIGEMEPFQYDFQ